MITFFVNIFKFLFFLITGLVNLVLLLPKLLGYVISVVSAVFPGFLISVFVLCVSIHVIKWIIGRDYE